jgi:hypothetical protein
MEISNERSQKKNSDDRVNDIRSIDNTIYILN